MRNITNILLEFTIKNNLWYLSKKEAIASLDKYFEETKSESLFKFRGLTSKDFILEEKSQELIFWQSDHETFIIKTTLSLFIRNNPKFEIGEYSLEVGENAEIEDSWLYFH